MTGVLNIHFLLHLDPKRLFFVALACALCWVNADDGSTSQLDDFGLDSSAEYEEPMGHDLEDRSVNSFNLLCIKAHNKYRRRHGVPPLVLDRNGVSGHFTQVVWKSSKTMGVGVTKGSNGYTYVAVLYYPPGNYQGLFHANVPRPRY